MVWLGFGGLIGLVLAAAVCKKAMNRYRYKGEGAIASPLAQALGQLVGIAGGIYVSLVLIWSFLGIDEIPKVVFCGVMVDFLALISLWLACLQPIAFWLLRRVFKCGRKKKL